MGLAFGQESFKDYAPQPGRLAGLLAVMADRTKGIQLA